MIRPICCASTMRCWHQDLALPLDSASRPSWHADYAAADLSVCRERLLAISILGTVNSLVTSAVQYLRATMFIVNFLIIVIALAADPLHLIFGLAAGWFMPRRIWALLIVPA